jgi:sulfur-carrier protein
MAVRVRLFAALREAAGSGEVLVEPAPLADLLDDLEQRFGEPFAERLRISTVLVDGTATPRDAATAVPDGAEVALLPPVSGGGRAASL